MKGLSRILRCAVAIVVPIGMFAQAIPNAGSTTNQTAAAPQTPRQALIEVLKSADDSALMKHLPEVAQNKIKEMGGVGGTGFNPRNIFMGGLGVTEEAKRSGSKVDIV